MQQPVRVLMLFTILNRGGAETMVMNYYRHIDRSKVQFDFVVHREERGAYEDEIEQLGGRIYRMIPLRPWNIPRYKRMIKRLFDEHPEYRIVHGQCSELGYYFYREASRRGLPVIIAHAHNSRADFDLKWLWRTYFKHAMRKYITQYFACGNDAAKWLFGNKGVAKAIILRNAIDTRLFTYSYKCRKRIREVFHLEDSSLLIGHVGRFERQKNHLFLLEVFKEMLKMNQRARLLLVGGTGDLENVVRQKTKELGIEEMVIFAGNRSDVPQFLFAMDAFLFPSLMEGLPLSLLEAQCAGLPCVISDAIPQEVCLTDLVKCLSLKESPETWADAVIKQATLSRDRTIYSQQIATAGYDIKDNVNWLQDFYLACLH